NPEKPAASTAITGSSGAAPGSVAMGSPARPEEIPTSPAPNFSPVVETPVAAAKVPPAPVVAQVEPAKQQPAPAAQPPIVAEAKATPATALAPARVGEVSKG